MPNTPWPALPYDRGRETYQTLHLWTQIIGKLKLARLPWVNHSWHVTLRVTPTGLTTGDIPANGKHFQVDFDFLNHRLHIHTSREEEKQFYLPGLSVAGFYRQTMRALEELDVATPIHLVPNEMADVTPFDQDERHATYEPEAATALHHALLRTDRVFTRFRGGFLGKCSPVHFFWGGFDLAVSRFSGRRAPLHPGGVPNMPDWIAREAYSHEVCSAGFWPGNEAVPFAAYYTYIYPEPDGYASAAVQPDAAYYHKELQEYILPYEAVQQAADPEQALLDFLQSTYRAAANQAGWDREKLEHPGTEYWKRDKNAQ